MLGLLWESILFRINSIFVVKKLKNSSAVNEELGGGVFLVCLLKVSNKNLALFLLVFITSEKKVILAAERACL